ncbi:ABC transporter permease [Streptomyces solicathayae]|uniref:ABC transporter permease n=1 Tax=Streptomyces solicathayae TaxID=3081768 RepID=A0ABZ0LYS5_9ACTN|nr:ABC transporter permease [Streptomyces sp. HUAS YS2]WOX24321.1 ABC transporter permease [Streptomyces sp. HUAS YS2]
MTGFVLLRVRAHRLLLTAALLAVLLTTSVLAALAGFSGSVGDAALRSTLQGRDAAGAALVVTAQVPVDKRAEADAVAREGARKTFAGLPVDVRKLERSGPYALPRTLQDPAARRGQPDLTHLAALDRSRITLVRGALPKSSGAGAGTVEVAVPESVAKRLRVELGAVLDLTDRLDDKRSLKARVTGVYRPADLADMYWQLDEAAGRGVRTLDFTTYGPLLADPALLGSGRLPRGETAWLATADFTGVTTDRIASLRDAATSGSAALAADAAPFGGGTVTAQTSLPTVLQQTERALLVSRSTLLIVAVQLVLLAAYTLLLVARLLSTERSGETELLRARGGSRGRIVWLASVEALFLALPAALAAPLLSGPLTELLAERSTLADAGLRLDAAPAGEVWLVAALAAVCCAAAVVAPALAGGDGTIQLRKNRSAALPASVRAGADIGLLVIAAVAYWQLDRQTTTSGAGGALSGDREGRLGIDPLLVAAPALALLAGTVLTLRLLPPAARLAERRAAGGRGLPTALAGWQVSRRPLRGAGPVLLLVLAVAMGMLAIGQSASWGRSQDDQADFRAGSAVRVFTSKGGEPGQAGLYAGLPGVRVAAPALRGNMGLDHGRTATVLALDVASAATGDGMLMRGDQADRPVRDVLKKLTPGVRGTATPGLRLPDGTEGLAFDMRLVSASTHLSPPHVSVVVEDRFGIPYRQSLGNLPGDGKVHRLTTDLRSEKAPQGGEPMAPAGPLTLTALEVDGQTEFGEGGAEELSVRSVTAVRKGGAGQPVDTAGAFGRWKTDLRQDTIDRSEPEPSSPKPTGTGAAPLTLAYGLDAGDETSPLGLGQGFSLRLTPVGTTAVTRLDGVASDAFLAAAAAKPGDTVDVTVGGRTVPVRIVESVRQLPTTGAGAAPVSAGAAPEGDGGGLLVDLRATNRLLGRLPGGPVLQPNEWWLATEPGRTGAVAAALRALPDTDPAQVLVRDETAEELVGDPLGAGPRSALMAVAAVAAALAAVGFAVSTAGSMRERAGEFGLLRALGAPRRQLARLIAAEQGLLIAIGLLVGLALGAVLTRAVVPLVVLTGQAARPIPSVLVELPVPQVALLIAAVAAVPLLIVAVIALRREDPATTLRTQGAE